MHKLFRRDSKLNTRGNLLQCGQDIFSQHHRKNIHSNFINISTAWLGSLVIHVNVTDKKSFAARQSPSLTLWSWWQRPVWAQLAHSSFPLCEQCGPNGFHACTSACTPCGTSQPSCRSVSWSLCGPKNTLRNTWSTSGRMRKHTEADQIL